MIYHVALAADLAAARVQGDYRVSSVGRTLEEEGFIHASRPDQLPGVLDRFYAGVAEPLVLLHVDERLLTSPVVVENGFPHVYGPIDLAAVVEAVPLARDAQGRPVLPEPGAS